MKQQKRKNRSAGALPVLAAALLLWSCGPKSCVMECAAEGQPYTEARIVLPGGEETEAMPLPDGRLRWEAPETGEPEAALLVLSDPADSAAYMEVPFIMEKGTVSLTVGEQVYIRGTKLNRELMRFFVRLQQLQDSIRRSDIALDRIEGVFSRFYAGQISLHCRDAVGRYVYDQYGHCLRGRERDEIKTLMESKQ